MGQILTRMVFGDAITVNNDDDIEDGEMNGVSISGPPGSETCDPEVSCGRSASTAGGAPHGTDSSVDAAGQRVGEHSRRGSLALDTWKCAVHRHRTGLRGEVRRPDATGSSGDDEDDPDRGGDPGGYGDSSEDENCLRLFHITCTTDKKARLNALWQYLAAMDHGMAALQLVDIMNVADQKARMNALWRYLAATVNEVSAMDTIRQQEVERRAGATNEGSATDA